MGAWRRGVVVGRRSAGKMKKKTAATVVQRRSTALVVLNRNNNRRSMERKLRQLQRIIPGGGVGETNMEALFHRIAAHIFQLESRVNLLKNVYSQICPP